MIDGWDLKSFFINKYIFNKCELGDGKSWEQEKKRRKKEDGRLNRGEKKIVRKETDTVYMGIRLRKQKKGKNLKEKLNVKILDEGQKERMKILIK